MTTRIALFVTVLCAAACGASDPGQPGATGAPGAAGPQGPAGTQGPTGPQGADATPTRITRSWSCFAQVKLTGEELTHTIDYDLVEFSDGFVFVSGSASCLYGYDSGAKFYAPSQAGHALAPLMFVVSSPSTLATAGVYSWRIWLNRTTGVFAVTNDITSDVPKFTNACRAVEL